MQQHVGERREVQPQLIGPHHRRARAIREQPQLLLLDTILHLATGAVDALVQPLRSESLPTQVGDDEPRVGPLGQVLRLANHPTRSAPALARAVAKVTKAPRPLPGVTMRLARLIHPLAQHAHQTAVARQTQHIADIVRLTPVHQPLAAKSRVATDVDARPRPALPDPPNNALELLLTPRRRVDVRRPQPRAQQMLAAEDVQRQVAVVAVVAVEEAALLLAVQRVVGGVEVEHDLLGSLIERLEEHVQQHLVDELLPEHDTLVAV